ncbi:zf-HC2 domain-containing protein [Bacillus safensis]|uniref:anti-sigma factor family protein n=1 Tax=Bacillus safensis TaxID=561879 RepID=UPI0022381F4A|nr:zf-HC2 domain-containing protein [Bacillus safensis]MCW4643267.1 zf-HC2 domain-containing protein [Bacillus safensis]MCY7563168.1 zf-HC2 domain-containing protein [Bacillus safensis]MCY7623952.1 zf-HC2 domain-containing protein [Bacillus safensis]MCY7632069.1 zf-HC2 domain-containing protein [Bacillus safensis]MCY7647574.1 zf-HC2 domain-containing protein [Bacillus safensis]
MSCYLIEELLPLYIEGDTSAETNKIVADHIQSCESCRHLYHEMKEPITLIQAPDLVPYTDEKEEKRKFEKRYYGKLLYRASIAFGIGYVMMIILYWLK